MGKSYWGEKTVQLPIKSGKKLMEGKTVQFLAVPESDFWNAGTPVHYKRKRVSY
ncbi:hypothetical protein Hanom_Chr12g01129801 [Helianthus anomalus]